MFDCRMLSVPRLRGWKEVLVHKAWYLLATSIFYRRDGDRFPEAIAALREAIRLDAVYARVYARLTALYAALRSSSDANVVEVHAKVADYAKAASALDPTLAFGPVRRTITTPA